MRKNRLARLEAQAAREAGSAPCPDCGREMTSVNVRALRQVVSADGTSSEWEEMRRQQRECPTCAPTRQTTEIRVTRRIVRPSGGAA